MDERTVPTMVGIRQTKRLSEVSEPSHQARRGERQSCNKKEVKRGVEKNNLVIKRSLARREERQSCNKKEVWRGVKKNNLVIKKKSGEA